MTPLSLLHSYNMAFITSSYFLCQSLQPPPFKSPLINLILDYKAYITDGVGRWQEVI